MRVTDIKLKNFKRFTDLEIKGLPATAKLVCGGGPKWVRKVIVVRRLHVLVSGKRWLGA
jgi:hypothetical protein